MNEECDKDQTPDLTDMIMVEVNSTSAGSLRGSPNRLKGHGTWGYARRDVVGAAPFDGVSRGGIVSEGRTHLMTRECAARTFGIDIDELEGKNFIDYMREPQSEIPERYQKQEAVV
jgi:hypothetical protein